MLWGCLYRHLVARPRGRGAVQALVLEAAQAHVVADDVQHAHHLAEHQHPARGRPRRVRVPHGREAQPTAACSRLQPSRKSGGNRAWDARRCPVCFRRRSSLSNRTILPELTTRRSTALESSLPRKSVSALSKRNGWLQHFFSSVMMFSSDTCPPPRAPCASSFPVSTREVTTHGDPEIPGVMCATCVACPRERPCRQGAPC